jgi:DnaJ-class molecular chaperone
MPLESDDYYALLGIHVHADGNELRRAWRKLASRWHPDRAGCGATSKFQLLSAAYSTLSDPLKRAAYDARRRRSAQQEDKCDSRAAAVTRTGSRPPPAPCVLLTRLSGPLTSLLACGVARLDEPGYITLMIRADEAAQGGMATVSLRVELRCSECSSRAQSNNCVRCGGKGVIDELFSAWLSVPPGVSSGKVLTPSVELPGMVSPVRFRLRIHAAR